jgi:DhnA family fructose-bisphosphate aldolase class Ia
LSYNKDFERIARSTTLPIMLLGGAAKDSPIETIKSFEHAMKCAPNVRGAMVGRNVTFVKNNDPRAIAMSLSKIIHDGYNIEQAISYIPDKHGDEMDFFVRINW